MLRVNTDAIAFVCLNDSTQLLRGSRMKTFKGHFSIK